MSSPNHTRGGQFTLTSKSKSTSRVYQALEIPKKKFALFYTRQMQRGLWFVLHTCAKCSAAFDNITGTFCAKCVMMVRIGRRHKCITCHALQFQCNQMFCDVFVFVAHVFSEHCLRIWLTAVIAHSHSHTTAVAHKKCIRLSSLQ